MHSTPWSVFEDGSVCILSYKTPQDYEIVRYMFLYSEPRTYCDIVIQTVRHRREICSGELLSKRPRVSPGLIFLDVELVKIIQG